MKAAPVAPVQLEGELPPPPNRTGLPDGLKTGIESLSGMAMEHVQVHYNSAQPAQLNALAYAQGSEIHVAPGQERHLPHEAWHVVQQAQGRVRPTMQLQSGVPVNDDAGLEREADVMGARASQSQMRPHEATMTGTVDETGLAAQRAAQTGEASQVTGEALVAAKEKGRLNFLSTTGTRTAFKEQPDLWTAAHETTHVVQQRSGVSLLGGVGVENDRYEQQADAVADRVVAGRSTADLLPASRSGGDSQSAPVQATFSGDMKTKPYQEIRDELVKLYADVPPQWMVNQLANDDHEYSTIDQIADKLGLKPLGNDKSAQPQAPVDQSQKGPSSGSSPKEPAQISNIDRLFVAHTKGVCYVKKEIMMEEGDTVEDLTRMYQPDGKEVYVSKEYMEKSMSDWHFTLWPPKKAKKPYDSAKPVPPSQGLAQMFTCWDCGVMADAANDCDWVTHDKSSGGCGSGNIIANGDAHSRNNEAFRKAMKGLGPKSTADQILMTLAQHPKAAAFWGLDHIEKVINTAGDWVALKSGAMYIHEDLRGFAAAMDRVAK